jgi:hypothetical protein
MKRMMQSLVLFGSLALALGAGLAPAAAQEVKKPAAPKTKVGTIDKDVKKPAAPKTKVGTADKDGKKPPVFERKAVRGTLIQIDGNKEKTSKVTARHKTTGILIEWTFPTHPRWRGKGSVTSSNPEVVCPIGVTHLVKARTPHGHGLAGLFAVKGKGKAKLTFCVRRGKEIVKITSLVDVKGKGIKEGKGKGIKEGKDKKILPVVKDKKILPVLKDKVPQKDKPRTNP